MNDKSAIFSPHLREKIIFAHHNFMKDVAFAEMHLVLCRNVLIYFDDQLKKQALNVLRDSVIHRGFLMLGDRESLDCTDERQYFERHAGSQSIYRKKLLK
jgi:chemotaxis protein methyltransferase CheR